MFLKITTFLGGKGAVKGLGAFCLTVFGIPTIILGFQIDILQPIWVIWVFLAGTLVGLTLLIGGIFAADVPDHK